MSEDINQDKIRIIAGWPRLLDVGQTAAYLSISPKTIRNGLAKSAEKPFPVRPKRFGRRVLFDIIDLDRYVDEMD
jgi:hypothetical protein